MNCDATTKRYTIKVPKDNSFTLILPLKQRTYVSNVPIDTPIVYSDLEDVVLTVGGVQYATTQEIDGVHVQFPDGIAEGVFDIILTATYRGAQIRAAYFEALTGVDWQYQSAVQQFIQGSPIMADAAFVIGGPLTDSELEELKAEYSDKIAAAEAAEEAAEAAKEAYDEKAEALDDIYTKTQATTDKEAVIAKIAEAVANILGTDPTATNTAILTAIGNISIDTSTIAKQGTDTNVSLTSLDLDLGDLNAILAYIQGGGLPTITAIAKQGSDASATLTDTQVAALATQVLAQAISNLIGTPGTGQASTLFGAIAAGGEGGGDAQESTSQAILAAVNSIIDAHIVSSTSIDGYLFTSSFTPNGIGDIYANFNKVQEINDGNVTEIWAENYFINATYLTKISFPALVAFSGSYPFRSCTALTDINMPNLYKMAHGTFYGCSSLVSVSLPSVELIWTDIFASCASLKEVYLPKLGGTTYRGFTSCPKLILIEIGRTATSFSSITLINWNPTEALRSDISTLVDPGETFANNLEKLLYNIREHIAANLPDLTGQSALTITFHANIKAAINADTATAQAFSNKNWTIA